MLSPSSTARNKIIEVVDEALTQVLCKICRHLHGHHFMLDTDYAWTSPQAWQRYWYGHRPYLRHQGHFQIVFLCMLICASQCRPQAGFDTQDAAGFRFTTGAQICFAESFLSASTLHFSVLFHPSALLLLMDLGPFILSHALPFLCHALPFLYRFLQFLSEKPNLPHRLFLAVLLCLGVFSVLGILGVLGVLGVPGILGVLVVLIGFPNVTQFCIFICIRSHFWCFREESLAVAPAGLDSTECKNSSAKKLESTSICLIDTRDDPAFVADDSKRTAVTLQNFNRVYFRETELNTLLSQNEQVHHPLRDVNSAHVAIVKFST